MRVLWYSIGFFLVSLFISNISMGVTTFFHEEFQRPPLHDLGHDTLPDVWVGHYTLLTILIFVWVACIFIVLWNHDFAYSIYVKFFVEMGILLIMRSFSIVVTIQPSPFGHLPPPPSAPWYWAFSYRNMFSSLGDNMFSAHTSFASVAYLCIAEYWVKPFGFWFLVCTLLFILQFLWIIASHLHYTADVIIALYLSFTLWFALKLVIPIPMPVKRNTEKVASREFALNNKLYV